MIIIVQNTFNEKFNPREIVSFHQSTMEGGIIRVTSSAEFELTEAGDFLTVNVNSLSKRAYDKTIVVKYPLELEAYVTYSLGHRYDGNVRQAQANGKVILEFPPRYARVAGEDFQRYHIRRCRFHC